MGWASAGGIFDPVARGLIEAGASDEIKRRVCSSLIKALQDGDWDTEGESLEEFADDPAIVAAFKENGVIAYCYDEDGPDGTGWCTGEVGHDGDHADCHGRTWPRADVTPSSATPTEQADTAKRARDIGGEIGALQAGYRSLESAPWYPARPGDIVHVHYEQTSDLPEFGETYVVEQDEDESGLVLRLLAHTANGTDDVGWFAHGPSGEPLLEPWFEAGPRRLTIIRDGRVIHLGGAA